MIDILDGIDIPGLRTDLAQHGDVAVFAVTMPEGTPSHPATYVIGADGLGFRFAFKHVDASLALPDLIASHMRGDPLYHGDNRETALGAFGVVDTHKVAGTLRTGGIAIDLARILVHAHHRLFDHPRPAVVAAVQSRLLEAGLDRIVSLIGPHRAAIQEACSVFLYDDGCSRLRMDGVHAEGLHGAILAYPAMAEALANSSKHYPLSGDPYQVAMSYLTFSSLPEAVARELLRQASLGGGPTKVESHLLSMLGKLPRDWMPAHDDAEGWHAFQALADTFAYAPRRTGETLAGLTRASKGRWPAYARHLARTAGVPDPSPSPVAILGLGVSQLGHAASDISDVTNDFRDTLIRPVLSWSRGTEVPDDDGEARILSHALLYRKRGLARILALSRAWHLASGVPLPNVSGGGRSQAWAAVLPEWSHGDVRILPLSTRADLLHEGGQGIDPDGLAGLHHCVGTHWKSCIEGRARVMGVRRASDGARLSTFEVSFSRATPTVSQHRGHQNADPSLEAQAAVAAYMSGIEDGSIPYCAAPIVEGRKRRGKVSLADACGYDWSDEARLREAIAAWGPYLAKALRGTNPDVFLERAATFAGPAEPT